MKELLPVIVGFLLTTVLGGALAHRWQARASAQQNEARLREQELERAGNTCATVMPLLDKRLYRMQRLLWAATGKTDGTIDGEDLESRHADYVKTLYEWNDSLNTNLSLVGSHFGNDARKRLELLFEVYKRVGRDVEAVVRAAKRGETTTELASTVGTQFEGREPGSLNDDVYQFGLLLMSRLRDGCVGRSAPDLPGSASP